MYANEDCHTASASCQSILVNLAKANQLQLLKKLLLTSNARIYGIQHMLLNHWDVDSLLRLESPELLPIVQKFASEKFDQLPLENYTGGEAERLVERLKKHRRGVRHDHEVRWNQPLPTRAEMRRQWEEEKIMYRWEEKSAYEESGPITGIQVAIKQFNDQWGEAAMAGWKIMRIRFAFNKTFEEWRATSLPGDQGDYWGEGGVEQDPFLLEEGEQVVEVTTYTGSYELTDTSRLVGLELLTTSGRRVFWGKKSEWCNRSVTKETFLAYCSGGVVGGVYFSLIFHWEQNKPTPCT